MVLFKLLGTVAIDTSEAVEAINETTETAEKAESKLAKVFEKIGSAAIVVGETVAAGLAVASTAVGALAKSALDGYADYEQLVGGVETLFGAGGQSLEEYAKSVGKTVDEVKDEYNSMITAQKKVLKNADKAYQTAGMSANEYMETVTGFSAALINSLSGDTEKAAEKADQAITDMSDNANKMGSSLETIKTAYAGFSRGQFTLLDNLKLGYGGTQEEMKRLLADAQDISGIEYDISSYADIVDAIHVIQEEMGIAGTTAKEASSTISGSISSMKSAWTNLVNGLGNEDADLSGLIDQFTESADTVLANVLPRIEIILGGITDAIGQILPKIAERLPELLNTMLPSLIQAAVQLFNGLVAALPTILQILITQLPYIVTEIGKGLLATLPILLETAKTMVQQLWNYISVEFGGKFTDMLDKLKAFWEEKGQPMWEKFSGAVKTLSEEVLKPLIETYLTNLKDKFDMVIEACEIVATAFYENVQPAIETIVEKFGELAELVWQAVEEYILPAIQSFVEMVKELYEENKEKLELVGELFSSIFEAIARKVSNLVTWFRENFLPFLAEVKEFVEENLDKIKATLQKAIDFVTGIIKIFIAFFKGDWEGMWQAIKDTLESALLFIRGVFELIGAAISEKVLAIRDSITAKFEEIKTNISDKLTAAKDKVVEIFDSIASKIEEKINNAKDKVKDAIDKIKGFFNFDVKLPDIKLPHFSIQPSGWQLGDLLQGSIPSLGIDWYAKGGVFDEPTILPTASGLKGVGEAGAEAVAPIDVLQGYVAQAVASQNTALIAILQKILEAIIAMDENMGGNLREALDSTALTVNHREFARLVKAVN